MENKVALVTGAGQGIGRAIAIALAQAGCRVIVADLNRDSAEAVATEIRGLERQAVAASGNVADRNEVRGMFAVSGEVFGPVEILVNNAGIFPFVPFGEMSEEAWDRVMEVNVKSLYHCVQEALHCMPDGGRIISVSSIASMVGYSGLVHYCASKGAVNGFTQALAVELADRNITVNAVAPGAIDTPGASMPMSEEAEQQFLAKIPLRRKGAAEDIAQMVRYLASPEASYITGQVMVVDGGWTIQS